MHTCCCVVWKLQPEHLQFVPLQDEAFIDLRQPVQTVLRTATTRVKQESKTALGIIHWEKANEVTTWGMELGRLHNQDLESAHTTAAHSPQWYLSEGI